MKRALDNFSKQAETYKKYRPKYPEELYGEIIQFVRTKDVSWDCGTGNGQVAAELSKYFKKVYATDLSEKQLANVEKRKNITYKVERAENTSFRDNQFDLITVAQAIHWFDLDAFKREIRRVSKNEGIVSIWGYGLLRIETPIDTLIDNFYYDIVGPYWNSERKHIDNAYKSIQFDFEQINDDRDRFMTVNWNLRQLEGYLNSWSSVQNYTDKNKGVNPVAVLVQSLEQYWADKTIKEIKFPIFLKVGRVEK